MVRPRSQTKVSKIEKLNMIIEVWGMNPNEILLREAMSSPHRTVIDTQQKQIKILNQMLKEAIINELQSN